MTTVEKRVWEAAEELAAEVDWEKAFGFKLYHMFAEKGAKSFRRWLCNRLSSWIVDEIYDKWDRYRCFFDRRMTQSYDDSLSEAFDVGEVVEDMLGSLEYNLRDSYYSPMDDPWTSLGNKCYDWLNDEYQSHDTPEIREELYEAGFVKRGWERLTDDGIVSKSYDDEEWF